MSAKREDVELGFHVEIENRKALSSLVAIEKGIRNVVRNNKNAKLEWDDKHGFGAFTKRLKEYDKGLRKSNNDLKLMHKTIRKVGGKGHADGFDKAVKRFSESYKDFTRNVEIAEKKMWEDVADIREKARYADNDDAKAAFEQQMKDRELLFSKEVRKERQKLEQEREKLKDTAVGPGKALIMEKHGEQVASRQKAAEDFQTALSDLKTATVGKNLAESFADGIGSLSGRDPLGVARAGAGAAAQLMKGAGKLGMKWGRDLQIAGTGSGNKKMEGFGKLLSGLGPLVTTMSKLGPILSMSASVMMSIVKLLVDIEAHAKEMNKQILEGASSAEFLYGNTKNVDQAFGKVSSTLDTIRDQATDIHENFKWGSTKDQVIQVTNALAQQGASLKSLEQAFDNVQKSAHRSAADVGSFGELARTSLAYSRLMGVSLQEISDFQAEMFTEMGKSVTGTKLEFARMTREASESGIATNKFFSILRGVSSDLGLYNTRLESAATLLKVLGKSMNPREAGKFLQFAASGVQKMDQLQRVRVAAYAGEGFSQATVGKDIASKVQAAIIDVAGQTGDKSAANIDRLGSLIEDFMKGNNQALETALEKVPDAARGSLLKTFLELRQDKKENASGIVGTGAAMGNSSPAAMLDMLERGAKNTYGKDIEQITGDQGLALRNQYQMSEEQFREMVALRFSIESQKRDFASALAGNMADKDKQAKILEQLAARKITSAEDLDKLSTGDVLSILERVNPPDESEAQKQLRLAQEQGKLVTSIEDKVGMIVDGIFNYLYKALRSLIDGLHEIIGLFPGGKKHVNVGDVLEKGRTGKNDKIIDKLQEAAATQFDSAASRQAVLKAAEASMRNLSGGLKEKGKAVSKDSLLKDLGTVIGDDAGKVRSTLGMSGLDEKRQKQFYDAYLMKGSLGAGAQAANLTRDELEQMLQKSIYTLGQSDLGRLGRLNTLQSAYMKPGSPAAAPGAVMPPVAPGATPTAAPGAARAPLVAATPSVQTRAVGERDAADVLDENGREMVNSFQNLYDALRRRGIMLDKTQLTGSYKDVVRDAMRTALFEYAMYSTTDQARLLERMKSSGVGADLANSYEASKLQGNALGGDVVGIAAGRAVVASPGEGLASVGKGEKIVPAGGRGGSGGMTVNVNGIGGADLANFLKQKIAEGIYEYKRREKYQ